MITYFECKLCPFVGEYETAPMSCLPSEVPRMMKAYPGSEYRVTDDGLAHLVVHHRQHKLQELKRRGYSELD